MLLSSPTHVLVLVILFLTTIYQGFSTLWDKDFDLQFCDVKWRVYETCSNSGRFSEFCVEDGLSMFNTMYYLEHRNETILMALPFYNNFTSYSVKRMIEALTSRCEINLIVMDNTKHVDVNTALYYPVTMIEVYNDSQRYAEVLNKAIDQGLVSTDSLTGLGYSLGAEEVGQVCRMLTKKCARILAIEPAGPLYMPKQTLLAKALPHLQLISRSDACHVVFVVCNQWMLGSGFRTAHSTIVVNGGVHQPSCSVLNQKCSHDFCNWLLIDAILRPGKCLATLSNSVLGIFSFGSNNEDVFTLGLPIPKGPRSCDSEESKVFYIKTADDHAKCLGEQGAVGGSGIISPLRRTFEYIFGL